MSGKDSELSGENSELGVGSWELGEGGKFFFFEKIKYTPCPLAA